MADTLKTALVGIGKVTDLHARALVNLPESEFTAVCGRSPEKTRDYAARFRVKPYTDVSEMVSKEHIDVVIICTPHPNHRKPAVAAMEAGANVLIEKPMASCLEDCDAMLETSAHTGKQIGMICQRRWYLPSKRVKDAIDGGRIGKPVFGTVNMLGWREKEYYKSDAWRGTWHAEGGGVLVNQAPHQLDLLQWYMGGIEECYGVWSNLNHPYIEVEDTANAILKFKNGGIGNIIVSNSQKPGIYCKVHVHGENGASVGVQTDGGAMFIAGMTTMLEPPVTDLWTVPGEEEMLGKWQKEERDFYNGLPDGMEYYHERNIEDFIRALLEGRRPLITGEDGRITVEIFTAIYRSNRDRRPVKWPLKPEPRNDFDGRIN
jgi:UDP-N-acetyl-2-amino-2-deoxyglucuronate dehydrogenase